jgi:hypothetical protein
VVKFRKLSAKAGRSMSMTQQVGFATFALLGSFALRIAWADDLPPTAQSRQVPAGLWGGEHVRMIVSSSGALLEYDCAHGKIDQPIILDVRGGFNVHGSYVPEHGGPRRDEDAVTRAQYIGRVSGDTMRLTVRVEHNKKPAGVFSLTRGDDPLLAKCR